MLIETFSLYEDHDNATLTSYVLEPSAQLIGTAPRPAVIINPGGDLIKPSKREGEPIALKFASMGIHAFVLNYSTYNFVGEDIKFPKQIIENAMAMEIIHKNAERWHIDTDAIGVCGFSVGGNFAAMYGTQWHTSLIQDAVELTGDQIKPAFMILGYPLIDLTSIDVINNLSKVIQLSFGSEQPKKDEVELYSPHLHVGEHTPPAFIWGTYADKRVDVNHTLKFAQAMSDAERPFELHIYENGPHNLATAELSSAKSSLHINPIAATWFPFAEKWLENRFTMKNFRINF